MGNKDSKYLKPESYYSDLYDRITVDQCRLTIRLSDERAKRIDPKNPKTKMEKMMIGMALDFKLLFEKGERYLNKGKTIQEWMKRDEAKDNLLASATPPESIRCLTCDSITTPDSGILYDWGSDKKDRVLFMYTCPNKCLPHRMFFDNGQEYRKEPDICPKCNQNIEHTYEKLENKVITHYSCASCGHKYDDEMDFTPKKKVIDKDFVKDRERFCLTKEEGQKYLETKIQMESAKKFMDDWKEKEKVKDTYYNVEKIKKLNITDLEKIIVSLLDKESYARFELSKPEMNKDVIIGFTVQDTKADRKEYDSIHNLQKLIKANLEKTNWRLMSEGINYRLGILSGWLRGYEREEDLLKLVKE